MTTDKICEITKIDKRNVIKIMQSNGYKTKRISKNGKRIYVWINCQINVVVSKEC